MVDPWTEYVDMLKMRNVEAGSSLKLKRSSAKNEQFEAKDTTPKPF